MGIVDLHMHSSCSDDGEFHPKEIVKRCLGKGIQYFSLTDHNSVKGLAEAKSYCTKLDIMFIPGIELDCLMDDVHLHLLGYGIEFNRDVFDEIESNILMQEQVASIKRQQLIRELGIDFSDEVISKLAKNGVVTGEMIAEAAMLFDYHQENPLLKPYYAGGLRSQNPYVNFYWDFCAQGKPAYVKIEYLSLKEAIETIVKHGGIPILAHPGILVKENLNLLEKIIACGVEGIEVYSSYHTDEQIAFYQEFTIERQLLMTCGSDFHGKTKPSIDVGSTRCIEKETLIIENLLDALRKRTKETTR